MMNLTAPNLPDIPIRPKPSARARRITLRKSVREGGFTVSYPKRLSVREVQEFINAHEGWLKKHYEPNQMIEIGSEIDFRGHPHLITQGHARGARFGDREILVNSAHTGSTLAMAFKAQAQIFAAEKVDHYARLVKSHANEIRWRDPKTRWGSCDSRGNIMLSWRLIMTPDWVFDYVIAHECAHLIHMDHSPRFWGLVEEIYPDYQTAKAFLKQEGAKLQSIDFKGG